MQLPVPEAAWIDDASCGSRPPFLHDGTQPYEKAPEPMLVLFRVSHLAPGKTRQVHFHAVCRFRIDRGLITLRPLLDDLRPIPVNSEHRQE